MDNETKIRWLVRKDLKKVLEIDSEAYDPPWTENEFVEIMKKQKNCIGRVAVKSEEIVGFIIYLMHRDRIEIIKLAVAEESKGQGIGTSIIALIKENLLRSKRKNELRTFVQDDNLDAQLFLSEQGFVAVDVLRDFYDDGDSAYLMSYRTEKENIPLPRESLGRENRIAMFL